MVICKNTLSTIGVYVCMVYDVKVCIHNITSNEHGMVTVLGHRNRYINVFK